MWLLIAVATCGGFGLAWQKYSNFNGNTHDLGVFAYAFAQTMNGKFLPVYFVEGAGKLLNLHPNCILLLWLPVYTVWRSFYSLLFFQSLMLAVSAWPLYLLAKRALKDDAAAVLIGATFLLFPTIASQHVNQIHDDQFALPFLMFAFYFFWTENFRKFVVTMVLACLAKETITITTAAFGIYALILRRPWKWVAMPLVFSFAYFILAVKIMSAGITGIGAGLYSGMTYMDAYGKSPAEVLNTFLTRPGYVLQNTFSSLKLQYLAKLFLPVLYLLPFLSAAIVMSLPILMLNLVSTNVAMTVIPWHYNVIAGGALLAASVLGIQKIADRFRENHRRIVRACAAGMLVAALMGIQFWYQAEDYRRPPYQPALEQVVGTIPREASVVCPAPMVAHFAGHDRVTTVGFILQYQTPDAFANYDFIVLDGNWRDYAALKQRDALEWIQKTNLFDLVLNQQNVYVFQKRPQPAP